MYDFRKKLFARTALAGHQYRKINRCDLYGTRNGSYKPWGITYDAIALFGLHDFGGKFLKIKLHAF